MIVKNTLDSKTMPKNNTSIIFGGLMNLFLIKLNSITRKGNKFIANFKNKEYRAGVNKILLGSLTLFFPLFAVECSIAQTPDYVFGGFDDRVKAQITNGEIDLSSFTSSSASKVQPNAYGDISFSIPIFDVLGRKLSYPLSLTYSPGIKVVQEAGWVGLGWSFSESYVQKIQFGGSTDDNIPSIYGAPYENVQEAADRFIVKLPDGRSVTVFQSDETSNGQMKFVVEDWKKWSITYNDENHRFIIKDESGIIYVFDKALFGANSRDGWERQGWNTCQPKNMNLHTSEKAPFHKWLLTSVLTPGFMKLGEDGFDPMETSNGQNHNGSWIRIFYEFSPTQETKKFEYTTEDLHKVEQYGNCSAFIFNDGMRSFEETYIKYIVTPTHIAEFFTEEEPYNPISELLDRKWSDKYDEQYFETETLNFYIYDNDNPWPFEDDFKPVSGDVNGEKKRRLKEIRLYENDLTSNVISGLTNPIKQFKLNYYSVGEATPGYDEERSMLKSVELTREQGLDPVKYTFSYHDVIQSSHLESGTNTLKRNNDYDQTGDRDMLQYYRSANNNPDESMIGPDGYFNTNSLLDLEGSINYEPADSDVKMWSLKKVVYPNASSIEFDYESDEYVLDWYHEGNTRPSGQGINASPVETHLGFGYRLKSQTITTEGVSKTYTYSYYSYKSSSSSWIQDVGRIYVDPVEYHSINFSTGGEYSRQPEIPPTHWFSKLTNQTPIYGKIKENRPDGSSIERYYNVNHLDFDYGVNTGKTSQQIFDVTLKKSGDLIKEEWYNDSQALVKRTTLNRTKELQDDISTFTGFGLSYWLSLLEEKDDMYYSGITLTKSWVEKEFYNGNGLLKNIEDKISGKKTEYVYAYDQPVPYNAYIRKNNQVDLLMSVTEKNWLAETQYYEYKQYYVPFDSTALLNYINVREIGASSSSEFKVVDLNGDYDKYGNPYNYTNANGINNSIYSTSKDGIPKGIFKNADYSSTFLEDFEDKDYTNNYRAEPTSSLSGWYVDSGTWSANNGYLEYTGGSNGIIWHNLNSDLNSGNQVIEMDIHPASNGIYAQAIFRSHSSNTDYYRVQIRNLSSGTKDLKLYKDHTLLSSSSLSSILLDFDVPVHLKIIISGGNIKAIISGKKLIDYTDSSYYASGGIGLYAASSSPDQKFDNLRIYPKDAVALSQSIDAKFLKISGVSDPNGIRNSYRYDDLGRLKHTRDEQNRINSWIDYSISENNEEIVTYNGSYSSNSHIGTWNFSNNLIGKRENGELIYSSMYDDNGTQLSDSYSSQFKGGGIIGGGLRIDGDDPYSLNHTLSLGDIPELDSPNQFSIVLWFKRDKTNFSATNHSIRNVLVANSSSASNDNIEIGSFGSNIEIYIDTPAYEGKQYISAGLVNDKWYHLALTYNGSSSTPTKLYLDGELIKSWSNLYWNGSLDYSGSSPLTLGKARPTTPWGDFTGNIDEFHVFNEALSEAEIKALAHVNGSKKNLDDNGNLLDEVSFGGNAIGGESINISHTYDNMNRKVSTTRPNSTAKTETDYYIDPLRRPEEVRLPGTGGDLPSTKVTNYTYLYNTSSETFSSFKSYGANTLHKTIVNDPNGKQRLEYVDGSGRKIASVVDMDNNGIKSSSDLVTEFGYDDLGNLNRVKDPKGFITKYEYNALSRLTRKKLPDQGNWIDYKYDNIGNLRFVQTAEHKLSGSYSSQDLGYYGNPSVTKTLSVAKTGLLKYQFSIIDLFYDGYDITLSDDDHNVAFYEKSLPGDTYDVESSMTVSSGIYQFHGEAQNSQDQYHATSGNFSFSPYKYTYNKYDDLSRIIETGEYFGSTSFTAAEANSSSFPSSDKRKLVEYKYGYESGYSGARYLSGNLSQVIYYNPNNFSQTPSKTYYSYNEDGLVEWVVQQLRRDDGVMLSKRIEYDYDGNGNLIELRFDPGGADSFYQRYTYDGLNRVIKAETSLTGNSGEWLTSAEYTYQSDGQVQQFILGEKAQTIDYSYDTRGWLTGINNTGSVGSDPQEDRFFQKLEYFDSSVSSSYRQYDGTIAKQTWGFDTKLINKPDQSYLYSYDNVNRLIEADRSGSGYSSSAFDVYYIQYDKNGNLRSYIRNNQNGDAGATGYMTMQFHSGSNRINYLEEGASYMQFDVDYDANGNLIKNQLHNLKKITYNLANMPLRTIAGSSLLQYRYNPEGQRVSKSVYGGTGNLYVRGANGETLAVFDQNGSLQFHNVIVGGEIIGKAN
ncbi:LamG-like jellyroll fold domain-containing protein [Gracilimonas tropica]|uniref:LamG-like jellyroll fold domain-containing protein n=1 Tax=Gracilimonas tropica TaxID=454600 RepID=UPI0003A3140E|nr:LamG-like jellyroll fold domain-containing protein [Gracilimonas tropica]